MLLWEQLGILQLGSKIMFGGSPNELVTWVWVCRGHPPGAVLKLAQAAPIV